LDVFDEYEDAEIVSPAMFLEMTDCSSLRQYQYEALRRVHLIPSDITAQEEDTLNANVFRNLDSPVSEGGENFSTGSVTFLSYASFTFADNVPTERNSYYAWPVLS
jgi:hypothetical protein